MSAENTNPPTPTGTEAKVCQAIALRQQHGLNKYGVSVAENPLNFPQWLQHGLEEALDLAVYLQRAKDEYEKEYARISITAQIASLELAIGILRDIKLADVDPFESPDAACSRLKDEFNRQMMIEITNLRAMQRT